MTRKLSLSVILFYLISKNALLFGQSFIWAEQAISPDWDQGNEIAVDIYGNSYITGHFSDVIQFGTIQLTSVGSKDLFVAKYDNNGGVLWAKRAGSSSFDDGRAIEVDSLGNCYVTGYIGSTSDFGAITLIDANERSFITKIDSNGNFIWAKDAKGTSTNTGNDVVLDTDGNLYVTGEFTDSVTFDTITLVSNNNSRDIFVAKYSSGGDAIWAKRAGSDQNSDFGFGICADVFGNCYVTGFFEGNADFDTTILTSFGNLDAFIAKYDFDGNFKWVKQVGCVQNATGSAVDTDELGNVFITGCTEDSTSFDTITLTTYGLREMFLAKYDSSGNINWVKQSKGSGSSRTCGQNIFVDNMGSIYMIGDFIGSSVEFNSNILTSSGFSDLDDIFTVKYDNNGAVIWTDQMGGGRSDHGHGIYADNIGDVYFTGSFMDTAAFGPYLLTSNFLNWQEVFIAKISGITGIEELEPKPIIKIYPNPFGLQSTLSINSNLNLKNIELVIYNLEGREVRRIENIQSHNTTVTRGNLTPGMYFYQVSGKTNIIGIGKLIIQ